MKRLFLYAVFVMLAAGLAQGAAFIKYDGVNESFATSLSNVIQGKNDNDDLLNISQNMDYNDIDFEDSQVLDEILGVSIGVACFEF